MTLKSELITRRELSEIHCWNFVGSCIHILNTAVPVNSKTYNALCKYDEHIMYKVKERK